MVTIINKNSATALSCCLLLAIVGIVDGCGGVTHTVISNRALQHYEEDFPGYQDLIQKHLGALQAGSPYPDYLYACGPDHDAGEEAHWPPFQAMAAEYIRTNYPKPWDSDTEKLVVFMMGVVSHYVADINWHGLSFANGKGFLEQLGAQNYNCSGNLCGAGHSAGDTGGEFVAALQSELGFDVPLRWYLPVNDLVGIYAHANATLTGSYPTVKPFPIRECGVVFFAEALAIKIFGGLIFPYFAAQSPFMVEHYWDYAVGGIDDDAKWTAWMWNRWESWLELGPPSAPYPALLTKHSPLRRRLRRSLATALSTGSIDVTALPVVTRDSDGGRGVEYEVSADIDGKTTTEVVAALASTGRLLLTELMNGQPLPGGDAEAPAQGGYGNSNGNGNGNGNGRLTGGDGDESREAVLAGALARVDAVSAAAMFALGAGGAMPASYAAVAAAAAAAAGGGGGGGGASGGTAGAAAASSAGAAVGGAAAGGASAAAAGVQALLRGGEGVVVGGGDDGCSWDYWGVHCAPESVCEYRYQFGDMTLGQSCRVRQPPSHRLPAQDSDCVWDYGAVKCANQPLCSYRYRFGDLTLSQSCRLTGPAASPNGSPAPTGSWVGDAPRLYSGAALAAGDFDGDGLMDIAVGEPGFGLPGRGQLGRVQVSKGATQSQQRATAGTNNPPQPPPTPSSLRLHQPDAALQKQRSLFGAVGAGDDGAGATHSAAAPASSSSSPDTTATSPPTPLTFSYSLQGNATAGDASFGASLLALDFNCDGVCDLAVAAPAAGDVTLTTAGSGRYAGRVVVFFGRAGVGLGGGGGGGGPDVVLEASEDFFGFGSSLSAGDLDGDGHPDLLVGSEWAEGGLNGGQLHAFLSCSPPTTNNNTTTTNTNPPASTTSSSSTSTSFSSYDNPRSADTADLILSDGSPFGRFGHHAAVTAVTAAVTPSSPSSASSSYLPANVGGGSAGGSGDGSQLRLLLVGAPGYRPGADGASYGRLYGYQLSGGRGAAGGLAVSGPVFTVTGSAMHGKTGYHFAVGAPLDDGLPQLVLSYPTRPGGGTEAVQKWWAHPAAGGLLMVPLASLLPPPPAAGGVGAAAAGGGGAAAGGLGLGGAAGGVGGDATTAAAARDAVAATTGGGVGATTAGGVGGGVGAAAAAGGSVVAVTVDGLLEGGAQAVAGTAAFERLGWSLSLEPLSADGSGRDVLLASAPLAPVGAGKEGGRVAMFHAGSSLVPSPSWTVESAAALARFGSAMVVADTDGDGWKELVVAAPFSSVDGQEMGGVVHVYSLPPPSGSGQQQQ